MKKGMMVCGLILLLIVIGSLFVCAVSAEPIIIDTEKGVQGFRTEPARDLPGNWQYVLDHPDTSADGWFDTNAYPPERGNGSFWYTISFPGMKECKGIWETSVPYTGKYEVFAWIPSPDSFDPYLDESTPPSDYLPTKRAQYKVFHNDGVATVTIDQNENMGRFTSLGVFVFDSTARVELSSNGVEFWRCVAFDAVKFVPVVHDMAVTDVSIMPPLTSVGQSTAICVTVTNEGTQQEDNVSVKAFVDGAQVGSTQYVSLDPGASDTTTILWIPDAAKNYSVEGEVGVVSGEMDTGDNTKAIEVGVSAMPAPAPAPKDYTSPILNVYYVPDDFSTIQAAVNAASDGDTIFVRSGTYIENVVVNKSVTLKGIGYPVVDANGSGSAITLSADGIALEGFSVTVAGSSYDGINVLSSNNTVTGNNVSREGYSIYPNFYSNNWYDIYPNATINNWYEINLNPSSNNHYGISLSASSNNTITSNNVNNNYEGIGLYASSNNDITGNTISDNYWGGVYLGGYYNNNNNITNNTFVNDGLFVHDSYQNTVEDNIVNGKPLVYLEDVSDYTVEDAGQVILVNCNNITVENQDISNASVGIYLLKTENSRISNNKVSKNNDDGIYLRYSSNNNITGNTVSDNRDGISIIASSNNNITGNTVSDNGYGIYLISNSNTITGNTFVNNGLYVHDSSYPNTVEYNTVNGKPLVYLEDVSDYTVEDAGQVILVNCNNITVENQDISNASVGIDLLKTENSRISNNAVCNNNNYDGIGLRYSCNNNITGNTVNNNEDGISLTDSSSNNNITGNNVSNNICGIHLSSSSDNNITGNTVSNNWGGISHLPGSSNNTITGNTVSNNGHGIYLYSDNLIYLNNFIDNYPNVWYIYEDNTWNSTEQITYKYKGKTYKNNMGNYWDDYSGSDANNDGIGDTPYPINSENDFYPLMERFENYTMKPPTPSFTSHAPESPVNDYAGANRTFKITINQKVDVSWQINDTEVQTNASVTTASYTNTSAAIGTWNVSAIVTNANGTDMQTWVWSVTSPCFIATAAYGTALHKDIDVLRDFRDEYLMPNPAGRTFVKIYYNTSPPLAEVIRENEGLRTAVREGFVKPLVDITRIIVE